ncbi:hypothetical protein D3C76_1396140 [compost metagenome]
MAKGFDVGIRHATFGRQRLRVKLSAWLRARCSGNLFYQTRIELVFHKPAFDAVGLNLIDDLRHLRGAGLALG